MDGMIGRIKILPDPQRIAQTVAEWMTETALASEGSFRVSLSGGSTPKGLYELLASEAFASCFPWQRVHWYWGDERFVPYDDPDSNFGMTWKAMLSRVLVPPENIHSVPVDGTPEEAALQYEVTLQEAYGGRALDPARPLFDITLLGVGSDGHTASLLPGHPVLQERDRWVAAVMAGRPEARITMTYPAIESSRNVAFLVSGEDKADVVAAIRAGGAGMPAASVRPLGETIWFLDRAAAGGQEVNPCHR